MDIDKDDYIDIANTQMKCTSCGKKFMGLLCPYCYRLHSIDEKIAIDLEIGRPEKKEN